VESLRGGKKVKSGCCDFWGFPRRPAAPRKGRKEGLIQWLKNEYLVTKKEKKGRLSSFF
jgi:hypothetical protein